jgi:hypothetical protein
MTTRRRLIFATALGTVSLMAGLAMAAMERCRARCTECRWAGPWRNVFTAAYADALRHQNATEHLASVEIARSN